MTCVRLRQNGPRLAPMARRHAPLRRVCAEPHACPLPLRLEVLAHVPVLAGLTRGELAGVDRRMKSLAWGQGEALYRAGEPAEYLFVLAEGRVKVTQPTASGAEVVTDVLVPGDLFGSLTVHGEARYPESAVALTTVCALRIGPAAFRQVLTEHPAVALQVLDDVAVRLERSRTSTSRSASGTVTERVAATLLRLADRVGQRRADGGTLLQLPLTRADLAGMTGSTPESVSRVMSRLVADGVVETGRRWTAVLDRDRLEELSGTRSAR